MPERILDLAGKVVTGDRRAIAQAISGIEDRDAGAIPLLKGLFARTGRAYVVGVTGSPGAGKSTLVEKVAAQFRRRGARVGILAVDPTSPFSGGAILGDRVRMQSLANDPGVFIRSMATRGQLGGLAASTHDAAVVLDAAGYEVILIETVGVGQDEVDVARLADVTVLLLVPGMGDDIQTFKAGVMEIADLYVVNKADRPGADRIEQEVTAMLGLSTRADGWSPPFSRPLPPPVKVLVNCAPHWRGSGRSASKAGCGRSGARRIGVHAFWNSCGNRFWRGQLPNRFKKAHWIVGSKMCSRTGRIPIPWLKRSPQV